MLLYAVRLIEDQQPVGLFWTPDLGCLWELVDTVCDPGACEYKPISRPAVIAWNHATTAKFGVQVSPDDEGDNDITPEEEANIELLYRGISFEFALEDFMGLDEVKKWKPCKRPDYLARVLDDPALNSLVWR